MPKLDRHDWTPDPEQTALWPRDATGRPVSGDAINGLGEAEVRRPRMVYWSPDPDAIPHGPLQRWFYTRSAPHPRREAVRAARQRILEAPLPEVQGPPEDRAPEDWTAALDAWVAEGWCERTGVAEMDPAWVYDGAEAPQSRILLFAVQHDFEEIRHAPAPGAGVEVTHQYGRAAAVAKDVAGWLRRRGWAAEPQTGPMTGAVAMIPPALACGFGELGKHGSLINPELGASFRLSAVLTDAPFAPTPRREWGIDGFCAACRICEDACPPQAIAPEKRTVRGVEKWYVEFDRCLPFFNETQGCAICIAACPWSRPGVGGPLAAKLGRRSARKAAEG